jgi:hypothetical protein
MPPPRSGSDAGQQICAAATSSRPAADRPQWARIERVSCAQPDPWSTPMTERSSSETLATPRAGPQSRRERAPRLRARAELLGALVDGSVAAPPSPGDLPAPERVANLVLEGLHAVLERGQALVEVEGAVSPKHQPGTTRAGKRRNGANGGVYANVVASDTIRRGDSVSPATRGSLSKLLADE